MASISCEARNLILLFSKPLSFRSQRGNLKAKQRNGRKELAKFPRCARNDKVGIECTRIDFSLCSKWESLPATHKFPRYAQNDSWLGRFKRKTSRIARSGCGKLPLKYKKVILSKYDPFFSFPLIAERCSYDKLRGLITFYGSVI